MPLDSTPSDALWLERLKAVGKMQARYLWFLVVAMIFYGGLESGALRPADNDTVKVPIFNLELDTAPILATGPFVLSFLVLVIMGTLKAYRRASEKLGITNLHELGEATDVDPNFLDLAFYSWGSKWLVLRYLAKLGLFKHAALLTLALAEAAWLWHEQSFGILRASSFVIVVTIVGGVVWIIACWNLLWYWTRRVAEWMWQ
jgi:hypothetical protein